MRLAAAMTSRQHRLAHGGAGGGGPAAGRQVHRQQFLGLDLGQVRRMLEGG
jgi:hypothetical protein